MMGRTTQATRQLASRGRRRIRGARTSAAEPDLTRQRAAVDAFFAAGRAGDFDALIAVLHPDVVLRADFSPGRPGRSTVIRGAAAVAHHAHLGVRPAAQIHPALINGTAGVILTLRGRPFALMAFTISHGKILEIDSIGDPQRIQRLTAHILSPLAATRT